jgi:molybdate transport system ATP-binding protein
MMRISIEDITIQAEGSAYFTHTSWSIEWGQNWAILGKTGSGKSVLAKAIAGQIHLAEGKILYWFDADGVSPGRSYLYPNEILTLSAETHREFIRQYAGYHQARWQSFEGEGVPTAGEVLSVDGLPGIDGGGQASGEGVSIAKRNFASNGDTIVDVFALQPVLGRKVHLLSHGESRKVFLARLLMQAPHLLILDDPYTGLDRESRGLLSTAIGRLIEQREAQILFVSSRLEDIPAGIENLALVKDGAICLRGKRDVVLGDARLQAVFPGHLAGEADLELPAEFAGMVAEYASALEERADEASEEILRMRDINIAYDGVEVLKHLSWTVLQGERWVLLGPNGAGKSTLLSLILADNPQSYANDILLYGRQRGSGESIWETKQNIGWVSPELHIYYEKDATCLEVICSGFYDSVGMHRRSTPEQEESAVKWLRALGLGKLEGTPFYRLSTGEQRLVLLARGLVKNPALLVLDEPCQGLDDAHRRFFLSLLDQICAQTQVTLIYVTHYQDEIPESITHRLELEKGEVKEMGPVL